MSREIEKIIVNEAKHNLKQAIKDRGWNYEQLGKHIGKSRQWVSCVVNDVQKGNNFRNLRLGDLVKIAEVLDFPLAYFFRPNAEKEKILWQAQQFEWLMKKVANFCAVTQKKHHSDFTDEQEINQEFERELERFGISHPEIKSFIIRIRNMDKECFNKLLKFIHSQR